MREEDFRAIHAHEEGELTGPRIVSVKVAQKMLGGVTYRQIGLMLKRGELRGAHIGRRRVVEVESINEYVDAQLADARKLDAARRTAMAA